ncbi:MAG: flavin reductase family protein [Pseudomonadota bacterium]
MSTPTENNQEPVTPEHLREALGQFATGVCVVTSPGTTEAPAPFAITVNSFAAVSLEPPLILWSIQKSATTYALWCDTVTFAVNILNADQADVCARFAIRGNHGLPHAGDYIDTAAGNPAIPGALAVFDCHTTERIDAGDHTILLASVSDVRVDNVPAPLIYHRGDILAAP